MCEISVKGPLGRFFVMVGLVGVTYYLDLRGIC